jgi:redox-sensitive bicupin YhaK (pirin superfamily)
VNATQGETQTEARRWVFGDFNAKNYEELNSSYAVGSLERTRLTTVMGFFESIGVLVSRGLLTRTSSSMRRLASGLEPYPWSAGAGAHFARHSHHATKHLYVLDGSIEIDGVALVEGEGIVIPAGTLHSAVVGPRGVTCVEAFDLR